MNLIKTKFAWLPIIVHTWRRTRALIWFQFYFHKKGKEYCHPFGIISVDEKYCTKIGKLSKELN